MSMRKSYLAEKNLQPIPCYDGFVESGEETLGKTVPRSYQECTGVKMCPDRRLV